MVKRILVQFIVLMWLQSISNFAQANYYQTPPKAADRVFSTKGNHDGRDRTRAETQETMELFHQLPPVWVDFEQHSRRYHKKHHKSYSKSIGISPNYHQWYDQSPHVLERDWPRLTLQPIDLASARPGDLLLFDLGDGLIHTGIYIEHQRFIHVIEGKQVVVQSESLNDPLWRARFIGIHRVAR